jgi:hypothetical protein
MPKSTVAIKTSLFANLPEIGHTGTAASFAATMKLLLGAVMIYAMRTMQQAQAQAHSQ